MSWLAGIVAAVTALLGLFAMFRRMRRFGSGAHWAHAEEQWHEIFDLLYN